MEKMRKLRFPFSFVPCFVCGVDTGPIRDFLIFFIGGLVLTSIAVLVWGFATGRFNLQDDDGRAAEPLRAEERSE
jgi:hypothetical protein